MQIKYEVKTYKVQYICDACNKGFMESISLRRTNPHEHICCDCGDIKEFDKQYPYTYNVEHEVKDAPTDAS